MGNTSVFHNKINVVQDISELPPPAIVKSEQEWAQCLTPEQLRVCIKRQTERAYTGSYCTPARTRKLFSSTSSSSISGKYHCACCDNELFEFADQFDSGTGWPSFTKPLSQQQQQGEQQSTSTSYVLDKGAINRVVRLFSDFFNFVVESFSYEGLNTTKPIVCFLIVNTYRK